MGKDTIEQNRNRIGDAPRWVHITALGSFGLVTLVLLAFYVVYRNTDIWDVWYGYALKENHVFAELIRPGIFRTPSNTWSNIAYIFVGIYIVTLAYWDWKRDTTKSDPYSVRHPALMGHFGIALIVLGFGSGLMHASLTSFGHKADVFGMFYSFTTFIALQWGRWFPDIKRPFLIWLPMCIVTIALSTFFLFNGKMFGGDERLLGIFVLMIIIGIVYDAAMRKISLQYRWILLSLLALAVGGFLQRMDIAGRVTAPEAIIQGHAVWHVLTGVMYGYAAYFYRTEVPRIRQDDIEV